MIEKVLVESRIRVLNLCVGVDIRRLMNIDSEFILISCFGSVNFKIKDIQPHVLLRTDTYIDNLKKFGMTNYLNVYFDDVWPEKIANIPDDEKSNYFLTEFNEEKAQSIFDFVNANKDKVKTLVVHCDAGISRSSAIALSICDRFNITKKYIHPDIRPNPYVLSVCKKVFNQ